MDKSLGRSCGKSMKRPDLNRLSNSFWIEVVLSFACNLSAAFALPDSAAHASDLFSKKSLFEDDDLFDDKEVKKAEAEQATRAKIEAANRTARRHIRQLYGC